MSARRTIARRITTTAAAAALAAGATLTAVSSAGAETTDLPSSVSDATDGVTQASPGAVILSALAGGTVYCLITSSSSPTGEDSCPS